MKLPDAARRLRPRQQRGLHRLEHEQRDAGEKDAVAEVGDHGIPLLAVGGEDRGEHRPGVEEGGGAHRPDEQPSQVRCDLDPRRVRTGLGLQRPARRDVGDPEQRRHGDGHAVVPGRLEPERGQQHAEHDAHDPVGAHHDGVGAEAARSGAHTAGEVRRRVADEREQQRHHHHPVAIEVVAGDDRAERDDHERNETAEEDAEPGDLVRDGPAALAERAAGADSPPELLLQRQEEPGRQRERGEPQRGDRLELVGAADGVLADLEEEVGGDAGDEQPQRDRDRSLGQ